MTTITIEVPDELANRLAPLRGQLPMLLTRVLATWAAPEPAVEARMAAAEPVWAEAVDFLASSPTREEIIAFRFSPTVQARAGTLLDRNRDDALSDAEQAELDGYELLNALLIQLKARAHGPATTTAPA